MLGADMKSCHCKFHVYLRTLCVYYYCCCCLQLPFATPLMITVSISVTCQDGSAVVKKVSHL